jgi:ribosomal protein S18 acetylase RimI-like enzyme
VERAVTGGASPSREGVAEPGLATLVFRRPVEADYRRVVDVVDEWWGGRPLRRLLPRLWFQHFTGTSWLVEDAGGRLRGFLVAFIGQDDPSAAYIHMVAADPNIRRAGLGRAMYERAFADLADHGARRVTAITWPGNRASVAFHRALGFRVDDGPGSRPIYGTPAYPDYDGAGDDRVVFTRDL